MDVQVEKIERPVRDLATFLLPLIEQVLVVPNVSVAEIIDYQAPVPLDDAPNWYLGKMPWRTTEIPLISFEALNDHPFQQLNAESRVAVFNGISANGEMPFWGLVTQGIPRQMKVLPEEVHPDQSLAVGIAEKQNVLVNGEAAVLPDLDKVEAKILQVLAGK